MKTENSKQRLIAFGISAYNCNAMLSSNPYSGIYQAETARTLDLNGGNPACNQGGIAVVKIVDSATPPPKRISIGLDRASFNQGRNAQYDFQVSVELQPCMTSKGPAAVCIKSTYQD